MRPSDEAPSPPPAADPWPELLPQAAAAAPDPPSGHVAAVLQQIRSGVRQRTAESATIGESASDAVRQGLLALRQREFVAEPVPFSHRASFGRPIVFVRKVVYHLFLKWFTRPVLEQQNGFNQAASKLLQDLIEADERNARERRDLAQRLADLERRLSPPPGDPR